MVNFWNLKYFVDFHKKIPLLSMIIRALKIMFQNNILISLLTWKDKDSIWRVYREKPKLIES